MVLVLTYKSKIKKHRNNKTYKRGEATAGFTFKYKTYPSGVSQKMQNSAYWISMFIIKMPLL